LFGLNRHRKLINKGEGQKNLISISKPAASAAALSADAVHPEGVAVALVVVGPVLAIVVVVSAVAVVAGRRAVRDHEIGRALASPDRRQCLTPVVAIVAVRTAHARRQGLSFEKAGIAASTAYDVHVLGI